MWIPLRVEPFHRRAITSSLQQVIWILVLSTVMISHHYSVLEFVSNLMNLLDSGSPQCIALPLPCCLSSLSSRSLRPSALGEAARPTGVSLDPPAWQRVTGARPAPFRVTHASETLGTDGAKGHLGCSLWFLWTRQCLAGSAGQQKGWRRMERVVPRDWRSVSGSVLELLNLCVVSRSESTVVDASSWNQHRPQSDEENNTLLHKCNLVVSLVLLSGCESVKPDTQK